MACEALALHSCEKFATRLKPERFWSRWRRKHARKPDVQWRNQCRTVRIREIRHPSTDCTQRFPVINGTFREKTRKRKRAATKRLERSPAVRATARFSSAT